MKVSLFASHPVFKSVREDRNTVSQLRQNNNYSLTEPNQRRISTAIENLANESGESNIEFLLDVGKNLTYQTRIPSGMSPKHDWRLQLKDAAAQSLSHSDPILRGKYDAQIDKVFDSQKGLNPTERAILAKRDSILSRCDMDSIQDNPNKNIRNLEKNMNYFIISSETPTKQKLAVLKKLDYFMSDDYEINPQLANKKTQVLAEMMNDMAINTPDAEIPNIKAINQKTHGMCAAIAIARKAMAYEDKLNYIDAIMSELDATDKVMIYDRQNLGSGKRVPVQKIPIDFDYAQEKGYRIIDASTLQWMNIAQMFGAKNESLQNFFAFDKNNFDAFHDSFFLKTIDDENLQTKQSHYQSLMKAKDVIGSVKSKKIKKGMKDESNRVNLESNINLINDYSNALQNNISTFITGIDSNEQKLILNNLLKLSVDTSENIDKRPADVQKYSFIPNEEKSQKVLKVKFYLKEMYGNALKESAFDKVGEDVVAKIEDINSISNNLKSKHTMASKIGYARQLYNAEAAYTAAILTGLSDPDILNDRMIEYDIPDAQTSLINSFDEVIDRIQNKDDKVLENHYRDVFSFSHDDDVKDDIINNLELLKTQSEAIYTTGLDNLYMSLGLGNRRTLLNNEIESSKESIKAGDKTELKRAAKCLKVSPDKKLILSKYDRLQNDLVNKTDDESTYARALNAMGYKNPLDMFLEIYQTYCDHLLDENSHSKAMLANFVAANGLQNGTIDDVSNALTQIGQTANLYVQNIEIAENIMEVRNENDDIYHSILPANAILKKMENEGRILPEKDMKKLQDRFTAIDKIKSQDEFARRSGKISKPELYKLSSQEKIALEKIDSNLNKMYADVVRIFDKQYREIKPDIQKLARYVGTNSGHYWVGQEGSSGLFSDNQVKIFEQLTDRPYHVEEDIEKGVDEIKNGVYSGVSSSSVFHHDIGMHAQYIADIEKGPNGNDILYHDNTWGASEHENTWIDSEGLQRTDYSDIRGGELGYVTNSSYRNGNYVENLVNKTGHVSSEKVANRVYNRINHDNDSDFDFALMSDIILSGANEGYKDIAGSFKDSFFIPDSAQVGSFKKIVSKMTKEQIKKSMFRVDTAGRAYHTKFDRLEKRVKPNIFNKGITTQAEYNALPDNDFIKLTFEKAAIRLAYPDATMYKELPAVKSMDDIKDIKDRQRAKAREYFDYSFGKDPLSMTYIAFEKGEAMYDVLEKAFKENKIKVKKNDYINIISGFVVYDKGEEDKFTGRVADNVTFAVNKLLKQIDSTLAPSESLDAAKEQIKENMTDFLSKSLYFNTDDLKQTSPKARAIRRYIDDKYNPQSDEEFVQIYRRLQDMTTEEFKAETDDVTDKDLAIKNITGFDVLKKFNISNETAEDAVRNTLYYDEFSSNFMLSETKPAYKYRKLERIKSGAYYEGARTFDDLYSSMKYSLMSLDYEKMFNKYADRNFRNYNAIPAYPKVDLKKDPVLEEKKGDIVDVFNNSTGAIISIKNTLTGLNLVHSLDEYRQMIPSGRVLTEKERLTLNDMIGTFITANNGDNELKRSNDAALRLIELDENATIDDYNADIDIIVNEFNGIEQINSKDTLYENLLEHENGLQHYFNVVANTNIPKKYHKIINEDAKNWLNASKNAYNQNNPYSFQQDVMELKEKVFELSNGADNKSMIEDFTALISSIGSASSMNSMKDVSDNVKDYTMRVVSKLTDSFVKDHIVYDKQASVKSNIERYISKQMHNSKSRKDYDVELDIARSKFMQDYTKYHLANQPSEVLEGYLMSNAKDADSIDNTSNIYAKYLEKHLDLAKLVEIQENLMEAVSSGNAAEVRAYFDDYNVDFGYGDMSMASDAAIDHMIRSILIENNTKTAKMFVEKLGLGDRIMKFEKDIVDSIDQKGAVDKIVKLIKDTNVLVDTLNNEGSKLYDRIDSSKNPAKEIDKVKTAIIKKTEKLEDKTNVDDVLKALDSLKSVVSENTGLLPSMLTANYIVDVINDLSKKTNEKTAELQIDLRTIELLYSFLLDLNLPEYSEGYKLQQQLQKSYDKHNAYYQKAMEALSSGDSSVRIAPKETY